MRSLRRLSYPSALVILSALACSLPAPITPTPDLNQLSTAVAGTLAAEAQAPVQAENTPTPVPTAVPTLGDALVAPEPFLQIVYTDGGDVWLWQEDAPPAQLYAGGGVERVLISDDGLKVAFARQISPDEPVEIRSVNTDGTDEKVIMTPAQFNGLYPLGSFLRNDLMNIAFLPGTHDLLVNTRAIAEGPGLIKYDDILVLDTDSGELSTLFPPGEGGDFVPSPDGSQLAIIRPTTISLANIDGSNVRPDLVTYDSLITYSEFQYYAQPVWGPDSDALVVAIPSADILAPDASGSIWRIPADGGDPSLLATIDGDFYFTQFSSSTPAVSPDLTKLAFLRPADDESLDTLYLSNVDANAVASYISGNLVWHGWAPNSEHFVFARGDQLDLNLGRVGDVATGIGTGTDVRWIDANRYVFLGGSFGNWTLTLGEIGGFPTALVSPDGDFISFNLDN